MARSRRKPLEITIRPRPRPRRVLTSRFTNANRVQRLPLVFRLSSSPNYLRELQDRRRYQPDGRLYGYSGTRVLKSPRQLVNRGTKTSLSFIRPHRVLVCVRRRRRREVLFAKRRTGQVGQKRPVRNYLSNISCKR